MKISASLIAFTAAAFLAALSPSANAQTEKKHEAGVQKAVAVLVATKGNKVEGTVTFTKVADGVQVEAKLTGLTPGKHGFHIHEFGDLRSEDGKAAGGHFNPEGHQHGAAAGDMSHAGDLGNVEADASGSATLTLVDKHLKLEGAHSILGRGVVVHAKADDLTSQPSGNAGDRVAVGVIGAAKGE